MSQALEDYAALYHATYGQAESVEALIPFMLSAFLAGDRSFAKARREQAELNRGAAAKRGKAHHAATSHQGKA